MWSLLNDMGLKNCTWRWTLHRLNMYLFMAGDRYFRIVPLEISNVVDRPGTGVSRGNKDSILHGGIPSQKFHACARIAKSTGHGI